MRAWWRKRKGKIIGAAVVLVIVAALTGPWAAWHLRGPVPLDVLVVDKTVARPDFRKHAALFWVLNHEKVVDPATGRPFDRTRDYAGYHPSATGSGDIVPISSRPTDLVYLSDTYGVFEDDLADHPRGARSRMIYGGMSEREFGLVLQGLRPGGTLVGEFNVMATPTPPPARAAIADTFGLIPTGWVGRHFEYLDLTPDLPQWIPTTWRAQTGLRWRFRGPGYVFVHDSGRMIVLVEGVDTPKGAIRLQFTPEAADRFGTVRDLLYDGWVEVVAPAAEADVLATYTVRLTASGATKVRGTPIGGELPAVVRTVSATRSTYYFTGDWSERPRWGRFDYVGIARLRRLVTPGDRDGVEPFFWSVYVPLMQRIIRDAADRRPAR